MRHNIYRNGELVGTKKRLPKNGQKRMRLFREQYGEGHFEEVPISRGHRLKTQHYRIKKKKKR